MILWFRFFPLFLVFTLGSNGIRLLAPIQWNSVVSFRACVCRLSTVPFLKWFVHLNMYLDVSNYAVCAAHAALFTFATPTTRSILRVGHTFRCVFFVFLNFNYLCVWPNMCSALHKEEAAAAKTRNSIDYILEICAGWRPTRLNFNWNRHTNKDVHISLSIFFFIIFGHDSRTRGGPRDAHCAYIKIRIFFLGFRGIRGNDRRSNCVSVSVEQCAFDTMREKCLESNLADDNNQAFSFLRKMSHNAQQASTLAIQIGMDALDDDGSEFNRHKLYTFDCSAWHLDVEMHLLIVHFAFVADCGSISWAYSGVHTICRVAACMGVSELTLFVVFNLNLYVSHSYSVCRTISMESAVATEAAWSGGCARWCIHYRIQVENNSATNEANYRDIVTNRKTKQRKTTTSSFSMLSLFILARCQRAA